MATSVSQRGSLARRICCLPRVAKEEVLCTVNHRLPIWLVGATSHQIMTHFVINIQVQENECYCQLSQNWFGKISLLLRMS